MNPTFETVCFYRGPRGHVRVTDCPPCGTVPTVLCRTTAEAFARYGKGYHGVRKGKNKTLTLRVHND